MLAAALDEALDGLAAAIDDAVSAGAGDERLRAAPHGGRGSPSRSSPPTVPAVTLLLRVRGNSEVELAALKRRRVIDDKLAGLVQAAVDEGRCARTSPRS